MELPRHQQHPQEQQHLEMQHDPALSQAPYAFYPQEAADPTYATMTFAQPMHDYHVVPNAHQPRGFSISSCIPPALPHLTSCFVL